MSPGVPGKEGEIGKLEFIGQMRHARGVFMAAMKKHYGAFCRRCGCGPIAVKKTGVIVSLEGAFYYASHDFLLPG